jgi:hypothetical protein
MVSLVNFFVDRCCGGKRRAPKGCDLDFKVQSVRKRFSTIELNRQKPIDDLVKRFITWKALDGDERETTIAILLAWFYLDRGFKYISSYERFKQMADQLGLPSSAEEFWKTYEKIEQEEGSEEYQLLVQRTREERRKSQEQMLSSIGSI